MLGSDQGSLNTEKVEEISKCVRRTSFFNLEIIENRLFSCT